MHALFPICMCADVCVWASSDDAIIHKLTKKVQSQAQELAQLQRQLQLAQQQAEVRVECNRATHATQWFTQRDGLVLSAGAAVSLGCGGEP